MENKEMTTKNSFDENECRKRIVYLIDTYCDGKQQVFADKCGIGKSSVSQYVNGTNTPGNIHASRIASAFDVNIMWVMGFDTTMRTASQTKNDKISYIPVLGRVSAGTGLWINNDIEDYLVFDENKNADEYFALRIKGDSMMPRICENDLVIAHRQTYAEDNDTIIAIIDDEVLCKRFKKFSGGVMLISNNSEYEPMIFPSVNDDEPPVHIIGKVIELRAKM